MNPINAPLRVIPWYTHPGVQRFFAAGGGARNYWLYWKIVALQCCVGFCLTSTQINHRYIHVPSLPRPRSMPHSGVSVQGAPTGYLFSYSDVCFPAALSIPLALSSPRCVHTSVFYVCVFTATRPCKQVEGNGFVARCVHTAAFLEVPTLLWSNPHRQRTDLWTQGWGEGRRGWDVWRE